MLHWPFWNICVLWLWFCQLRVGSVWLISLTSQVWWLWWGTWVSYVRLVSRVTLVWTTSPHMHHSWISIVVHFSFWILVATLIHVLLWLEVAILVLHWHLSPLLRMSLGCHRLIVVNFSPWHDWGIPTFVLVLHDFIGIGNVALPVKFLRYRSCICRITIKRSIFPWATDVWKFSFARVYASVVAPLWGSLGRPFFSWTGNTWLPASRWVPLFPVIACLSLFSFLNIFLCLYLKGLPNIGIPEISWSNVVVLDNNSFTQLFANFLSLTIQKSLVVI